MVIRLLYGKGSSTLLASVLSSQLKQPQCSLCSASCPASLQPSQSQPQTYDHALKHQSSALFTPAARPATAAAAAASRRRRSVANRPSTATAGKTAAQQHAHTQHNACRCIKDMENAVDTVAFKFAKVQSRLEPWSEHSKVQ